MRGGRGRIGEVAPGKLSVGEQPASERHLHLVLLAHIYLACDDVGSLKFGVMFGPERPFHHIFLAVISGL